MLTVITLIARGAIVLLLALLAVRLLRRGPASLRHTILAAALSTTLALPVLATLVPTWHTGAIAADPVELAAPPEVPVAELSGPVIAPLAATPVVAQPAPSEVPWGSILLAIWAAGVAGVLIRSGTGAVRARLLARRGQPTFALDALATWRAVGGRGEPPRIVTSTEIEAPILVGAIAPVVVVPASSDAWTAERWRVVLLHELAHVRRRDGLANLIAQLACALHWFDPVVWIAARRLREERELAADDAVLRGGARASSYAEHLVAIATASPAPVSALAMAEPSRFEARVVALLDGTRSRNPARLGRALAAIGAAAIAIVAACISPEATSTRETDVASIEGAPQVIAKSPLQGVAEAELDRVMREFAATGAIAIVLDAKTGAVITLATRGDGNATAARAPGSTMKPFTFAAALDAGVATAESRIDCEDGARSYGDKTLRDASPHRVLDLGGILAVSSNVCTAKLAEPLGDKLGDALRRYHFAAPAHIDTRSLDGVAMMVGGGIQASALDVATGYTAFADGGLYHKDGASERVMEQATARSVLAMMERVVGDAEGTGHAARIDGVRVAGKTGTMQSRLPDRYYASFVGIVPADAPKFVVLVGVDNVASQGGKVAAPVFAKIAATALGR